MSRHHDYQQFFIPGRKHLEQHLLFAVARIRQQQHRARELRAPGPARAALRLVRGTV